MKEKTAATKTVGEKNFVMRNSRGILWKEFRLRNRQSFFRQFSTAYIFIYLNFFKKFISTNTKFVFYSEM